MKLPKVIDMSLCIICLLFVKNKMRLASMLLGLLKNVDNCMLDSSKVVHFFGGYDMSETTFGKFEQHRIV